MMVVTTADPAIVVPVMVAVVGLVSVLTGQSSDPVGTRRRSVSRPPERGPLHPETRGGGGLFVRALPLRLLGVSHGGCLSEALRRVDILPGLKAGALSAYR